eukprot:TRINITY_DN19642_c0_g1_i3.p1 TRINITY_DN19642_c0_g1~~TRINITY_DN19642_c0_g1_i3.p1  ORF type:complete len:209 (+),score=58.95 TRINITY_DN19642_c0_g1_i3:615-1241(+)
MISSVDGGTIDEESIRTFFEYYNIDPNDLIEGHPLIFYPISTRNKTKIHYLLQKGAKLDVRNKFQVSPVHVAFSRGILIDMDKLKPILPSLNMPTRIQGHRTLLECLLIGMVLSPEMDFGGVVRELQLGREEVVQVTYFLSYFLGKFGGKTDLLDGLLGRIVGVVRVRLEGDFVYRLDYLKKWWLTQSVPISYQIPPAILQACEAQGI